MAYLLATSHRLEDLLDAHQGEFRTGLFSSGLSVVVQNQNMAQWLKLHLAERWGAFATPDLLLPDMLVRTLLERHGRPPEGQKLLFMDELKTRLFFTLRTILAGSSRTFEPLARYCDRGEREDRLFELADHIAGLFHSYAMNGRSIVESFRTGKPIDRLPLDCARAWEWQRELWERVFASGRFVLAGVALEQAASSPPPPDPARPKVVFVGSAFLSRQAARFVRSWAESDAIDVVHLLLTPATDLTTLTLSSPWKNWSRFGKAFVSTLPQPQPIEAPSPMASSSALEKVQSSLARGSLVQGIDRLDTSLQIVSCVNRRRELEVLKDRILAFLDDNPDVRLNQIAVLAPDMNAYAPFLDAVMSSDDPSRNLAHHVIDLSLDRDHSFFQAVRALLGLLEGRWERSALFSFLRNPCVCTALEASEAQIDAWLEFSDRTASLREEPGTDEPERLSWEFAWRRLLDGLAWSEEENGVSFGTSRSFPLDVGESTVAELEPFFAFCRRLRALSSRCRSSGSFLDRIHALEDAVSNTIATSQDLEAWGSLTSRLYTLARDLEGDEAERPISWSGFASFVRDQIQHFSGRRGQLLLEGVHFSSLKPLRALPFQAIAILGLDESSFPAQTTTLSFDLRPWEEGHEDLSSSSLDRYTFWEIAMSARKALFLSYCGRDAVTGERRPPSSVVSELQDYLVESGVSWRVDEEPVHAFSDLGVSKGTYSIRAFRQNRALANPPPTVSRTIDLERVRNRDETEPAAIGWEDVTLALRAPARSYLQRRHGIYLRDEDRREEIDRDPREVDEWEANSFLKDLWWKSFELGRSETLGSLERKWDADVGRGLLVEGSFLDLQRFDSRLRLEGWWKAAGTRFSDAEVRSGVRTIETRWAGLPLSAGFRYVETEHEIGLPTLSRSIPALKGPTLWETSVAAALLSHTGNKPITAAVLSSSGASKRWTWSTGRSESHAWLGAVESYFQSVQNEAIPFYSDYVEALQKIGGHSVAAVAADWAEAAWHDVFSSKPYFHDGRTLRYCPYARLCFERDPDFERIGELLNAYWSSVFEPLSRFWEQEDE